MPLACSSIALVLPGLAARWWRARGLLVDGLLIDERPLLAPPVDMFGLAAGPRVSLEFCAAPAAMPETRTAADKSGGRLIARSSC